MSNYNDRLKKLQQNWKTEKAAESGSKLPEGKYQWIISRATLGNSKASFNKGNVQFTLELKVAVGPMKGRKVLKSYDLESKANPAKNIQSGLAYFKRLIEDIQLDMPASLEERELKKLAESMVNMVVYGACVHNAKGYANYYINGLVDAPQGNDDDEKESSEEETEGTEETDTEDTQDSEESSSGSSDNESSSDGEEETTEVSDDSEVEEEPVKAPPKKTVAAPAKKPTATAAPAKKTAPKKESPKSEDDDWDNEFNK